MKSKLRLPISRLGIWGISFVGHYIIRNLQKENVMGQCYEIMTEVEIEAIIIHLSAVQISSWIWTTYRSSLERAQSYLTYNQLHCISSNETNKQSLEIRDDYKDFFILDTKYLMQIFDERLVTIDVKKKEKNRNGNEEEKLIVESRSSSRLTSNDETQIIGGLQHKNDYKRLALVFDPFCYINRYNVILFNPYLRVSTEYYTSIIPRSNIKSELGGDIQSTEESLVRCIPYKQSYFTNLMGKYFAIDDTVIFEKIKETVDLKEAPQYPLALSCWPIYNHSPMRSISRFLEMVYISLGSLQLLGNTCEPVLCSSDIIYNQKIKKNKKIKNISWFSALPLANSVESLRILAFELYKGIHPQVFTADWFLSEGEIARANIDTSISYKKKEISDKGKNSVKSDQKLTRNPFFIGRNINGSIRVHRLLKLSKGFQMYCDEEEEVN
jgi:hypothetical protein